MTTGFPDDDDNEDTVPHEQDPTDPTGVVGTPESVIRPRERKRNAAMQMRLSGYSWDEIAEVVGYPDAKAAQVAFETALEQQLADDPQIRAKMRDLASRRYERLLRSIWTKAIDPASEEQMVAQQRALTILAQQAKLLGLDAAQEIVVHSPTNNQLQEWVSGVLSQGNNTQEADIFGNPIIEGEWEEVDDDDEGGED